MGPGETFAAIALAGVAIGVLIATTEMVKRFIAYKEAKLTAQGSSADHQALEERVRVLERIVTARGHDLAAEIEALRDSPAATAADAGVPLAFAKERA